jgi:recombination DNA repair RAD52 pathway protein
VRRSDEAIRQTEHGKRDRKRRKQQEFDHNTTFRNTQRENNERTELPRMSLRTQSTEVRLTSEKNIEHIAPGQQQELPEHVSSDHLAPPSTRSLADHQENLRDTMLDRCMVENKNGEHPENKNSKCYNTTGILILAVCSISPTNANLDLQTGDKR